MKPRLSEKLYEYFSLREILKADPVSSKIQHIFVGIALFAFPLSLLISLLINCPHQSYTYNQLCKPIIFNEGDMIPLGTPGIDLTILVGSRFKYTGHRMEITRSSSRIIQESLDGLVFRQNFRASVSVDPSGIDTDFGSLDFEIHRQDIEVLLDKSWGNVNQLCTFDYDPIRYPNELPYCAFNQTLLLAGNGPAYNITQNRKEIGDYMTLFVSESFYDAQFPPFDCTSCLDYGLGSKLTFSWTYIFLVIQSLFSIYSSVMVPVTLIFSYLINRYSAVMKQKRKDEKLEGNL